MAEQAHGVVRGDCGVLRALHLCRRQQAAAGPAFLRGIKDKIVACERSFGRLIAAPAFLRPIAGADSIRPPLSAFSAGYSFVFVISC